MRTLKLVLFALSLFYIFLLLPSKTFAGEEFATSYNVTFDVDEAGITTVTEKISLKNLTSKFYANQFKLTIGTTQISDVQASDQSGPMETSVEQKDTSTVITVKFNQEVAGINKELPWILQFKSKDFAEKQGKVWEVRAPKISSSTNLDSYNMTISVPVSFGELSLISPTPKNESSNQNRRFLTFEKDQLINSGVSASFGDYQLFDFDLSYHLENDKLVPIVTNIALPPDTAYQDVIFQRINPKPVNVTVDEDGNYLAWYRLVKGEKMDVRVIGSAKLYTSSKANFSKLSSQLREKYTSSQKYWEKDNPIIKNTLSEILGQDPPTDPQEKVRLIYRYVVDTLKYDLGRINKEIQRYGAVTALNNPENAVCMEFTDLFIALLRAANIPARELNGFAYTSNEKLRPSSAQTDILHSWPEYWDEKNGWVMVDPTWENTTGGVDYFNKLDLNHLTFVIKGFSSEYPIPAGAYKLGGEAGNPRTPNQEEAKDVKATLSDRDFLLKPQLNVEIITPDPILAGFTQPLKIKITNEGNGVYSSNLLSASGNNLIFIRHDKLSTGPIPAFGSAEFEFSVRSKTVLDSFSDQISVKVGSQNVTKNIEVKPFILIRSTPILLTAVLVLLTSVYIVILSIFIFRKGFIPRSQVPISGTRRSGTEEVAKGKKLVK
ncbi:transglutaminase domain-containing protein [Candidatus Daviesbacteria bacterium]|nr:transglutaminase domain-containing protein [Candidatus Daviesbacteria bacterium]